MDDKTKRVPLSPCVIHRRFEITETNYKDLAVLSDKYFIPSLQKDIRVNSQKYVVKLTLIVELLTDAGTEERNRHI